MSARKPEHQIWLSQNPCFARAGGLAQIPGRVSVPAVLEAVRRSFLERNVHRIGQRRFLVLPVPLAPLDGRIREVAGNGRSGAPGRGWALPRLKNTAAGRV